MARSPLCPCTSGLKYAACCAPFHQGAEPPTAQQLMRSRYAAFALGDVAYLWRTLHPAHPDRQRPEPDVTRELRQACRAFNYVGLTLLEPQPPATGDTDTVLFLARLFDKGKDRSFVELSDFGRTPEGWRYRSGEGVPTSALPGHPETLTRARLREVLDAAGL